MCNWTKWIWPGILATVLITALATLFKSDAIEADLTAKANQELSAGHSWASVELDGRDLTIKGLSPSEDATEQALNIVEDQAQVYDIRIAKSEVEMLPIADPFKLTATKGEGEVVLAGNVPDDAVRAEIIAAAKKASPDSKIVDQMTLARGVPAGFAAIAGFGISQLKDLTKGTASLENTALSVSGVAPSVDIFDSVTNTLNTAMPAGGKLASSNVTAPIANPYTLVATKSDSGIRLSGFAPSNAVRSAIVDNANKASNGKKVTFDIKLAKGEPENYSPITAFAIAQLTDLTSGEAKVSGSDISVTGSAPTVEIFERVTATLNDNAPAGGNVVVNKILSPFADPYTFSAIKNGAGIVLKGFVPSNALRASLVAAAKQSAPGKEVIDQLQLAKGQPEGFETLAKFGIAQLSGLLSGEASSTNLDLSVKGVAATPATFKGTTTVLAGAVPAGKVVLANISPPRVSPYIFSATENDAEVVLDGFVPDNATRSALVEAAKKANPSSKVVDNLQIATGAPKNFAAIASFGVSQLNRFSTGFAGLSDTDLTIRGTALSPDDYTNAVDAAAGTVPAPAKIVTADISASSVSPYIFSATKDANVVVLDGYVRSSNDKNAIVAYAKSQNADARIIDRLLIANGAPIDVQWSGATRFAVSQVSQLEKGSASIKDAGYTVEGLAATNDIYGSVTSAANGRLPSGLKLASEDVTRPDIVPYVWQYSRPASGDNVSLSGFMPVESISSDNEAQILAAMGTDTKIANTLQIGAGAPRNFAAATSTGINTASRLTNGRAFIRNNVLMVTGEALSEIAARGIRRQVENSVPPGFTGKHIITFKPVEKVPEVKVDQCNALLTDELKNNSILFAVNKNDIRPESFGLLDRLASVMQRCPATTIAVEGHTDSDGPDSYNQALSERRANAVRDYLTKAGIVSGRMNAKGFGESQPIASNATAEGKALNRRIEFSVTRN